METVALKRTFEGCKILQVVLIDVPLGSAAEWDVGIAICALW